MISSLLILISTSLALAKDLGTFGETFPIAEENLAAVIEGKLKHLSDTGQLETHQQIIQERVKNKAMNPEAVLGIRRATESKTRLYDPSITVPYDLKDHEGTVFHKKGTVVNPLRTRPLTKPLIFVNGEDKDQISWALQEKSRNESVKVILVAGSPFKLSEEHGLRFYFDQGGKITEKLGIKEVPTKVTQYEDKLQITSIALTEEKKHDN